MEPLLGLLTGESMEFLVRLTEGKKVTLADCLGMLGELDVYFACGLRIWRILMRELPG